MNSEQDLVETGFGCVGLSLAFAIAVFTIVGAIALLVNEIFD